jgi:iron complex transport system ATP-binding protein
MSEIMLEVLTADFRYANSDCGITGVSLQLSPGRMTGLIGSNGAGKSTLMQIAAGLILPSSGSVKIKDRDISGMSRRQIARHLGYQPQMTNAGIFDHTVEEVVSLGRYAHTEGLGFLSDRDMKVIDLAMDQTDTRQFRKRRLTELSGGERQRVLLASVLVQQPDILLLDEPGTGLDIHHQSSLFTMLGAQAKAGMAVAVVTHDLNLASMFCDNLILMSAGQIVVQGDVESVIRQDVLQKVYGRSILVDKHPAMDRPAVFTMPLETDKPKGTQC